MNRDERENREEGEGQGETYSIASTVFLLSTDDGAAALGSVEGTLPAHDSLAWSASAAAGLAPNLGDAVPVIHLGRRYMYVRCACYLY